MKSHHGQGGASPTHGQGPRALLWAHEAEEMVLTIIKNFVDQYAPRRVIWTRPERGYSKMSIELISSKATLRVTSSQSQIDEKTETITIEMLEDGKKVRSMSADVKATGLLAIVWEGMKHKLELRKKYCYGSKTRQGEFFIEQHSIDACFMPDESEVEDEWI